jgi:serine protease Do
VDAKDLPAVDLANSDQTEVGDLVLAIGNPFGVGQTVTMGIISAKDRGNLGLDYEDFIQTDAAINPGNSGGALVDADGRLIGINTAILSRSGGNQGIGFAVPANLARNVMEGLVKDGRVVRSYLGVSIQDLTPALAKEFDLKNTSGVVVSDVVPKSPAEKAGLKAGDVITDFNGKPVQDSRHLKLQTSQTPPGTTVPVKILRDGKSKTIEVAVKELPSNDLASGGERKNQEGSSSDSLNGVAVSDIDNAVRHELNLPTNIKGALVQDVAPDSAAFEAGLRRGDVIQEINRKAVAGADDAVKLTDNVKEKKILLRVWSKDKGGSRYLIVDESKAG